jgi:ubiquinone/menaquinone biosynthesis C-methylase UbiE
MEVLYNSHNPLVRYAMRGRLESIVRAMPEGKLKVLDAGCGEGQLIRLMHERHPQNKYFGVDITPIALKKAQQRCPFATIKRMDLLDLKFPDESFDLVVCTEVIEHVYEYKRVIREFKRVLKKGGVLIITFPNEPLTTVGRFFLGRRPIKVPDHVNSFTPGRMRRHVGLPVIRKRNMPFGLFFVMSLGSLLVFKK